MVHFVHVSRVGADERGRERGSRKDMNREANIGILKHSRGGGGGEGGRGGRGGIPRKRGECWGHLI